MIKPLKKKGQILAENVIFIVLNLIFLTILIFFVYSKAGSEARLEEKYSKQIALIVDSAKPGMIIYLNMEDAISKANSNNFDLKKIVSINNNKVTVKLRDNGENSYYFFNNVNAKAYPEDGDSNNYIIYIGDYK